MPTSHAFAFVAAASVLAAAPIAAQPALLVYKLGADTLAIEQYTRTGDRLVGEMAQRTPTAVTRLQYDIAIGRDGRPTMVTLKRLQADGTPVTAGLRETRMQFTRDSAIRENVFPDSVQRQAFATPGAAVANFPVFVYGPTELVMALRRTSGDTLRAIGLTGNPGIAGLADVGSNTYRMNGAPYAMLLRFDANGRLQSVDGTNTTNKIVATRAAGVADFNALARTMRPSGALSGRGTTRVMYPPGGIVLIDYGRPNVRERTVWGGTLVPFDSIWRAGANEATHLFTTRTLTMGDLVIPPGMYTLFVQHTRSATYLVVSKQTGQWGTQYTPAQDLGRVAMQMSAAPSLVEEFTIALRQQPGNRGVLDLSWGTMTATVPFTATIAR